MLSYAALGFIRTGGRKAVSNWSYRICKLDLQSKIPVSSRYTSCASFFINRRKNLTLDFVNTGNVLNASPCVSYSTSKGRELHTSRPNMVLEDHNTKSLTIWQNIKHVKSSPVPALTLGLAGLIPFVAAPVYMISLGIFAPQVAFAQVVYGACILSFLGGVRWGFTIPEENPIQPDWVNLGYSVTPSLIACLGLLLPSPFSLLTVMAGLTLTGYFDMAMYGYPPWFKGLRFTLSFVALLSLWTTFMCSFLIRPKDASNTRSEKDGEDKIL